MRQNNSSKVFVREITWRLHYETYTLAAGIVPFINNYCAYWCIWCTQAQAAVHHICLVMRWPQRTFRSGSDLELPHQSIRTAHVHVPTQVRRTVLFSHRTQSLELCCLPSFRTKRTTLRSGVHYTVTVSLLVTCVSDGQSVSPSSSSNILKVRSQAPNGL